MNGDPVRFCPCDDRLTDQDYPCSDFKSVGMCFEDICDHCGHEQKCHKQAASANNGEGK